MGRKVFHGVRNCGKFRAELVSHKTISTQTYSESILVGKKKAALWSRRLNVTLCANQELLMTLNEYREMCLVLLLNYKENQHSLTYLKDLVETNHIFLKLFEQFAKSNWHLAVQNKFSKEEQTKEKKTHPPTFNEIAKEISSALQEKPSLTETTLFTLTPISQ